MAKESGLGWTTLEVDDATPTARDIKNDVTNLEFATPRAVQDSTGIDKTAMERILLLGDFSITINGIFNTTANASHDVFKTVCSQDVTRTVNLVHSGDTLANECLLTDYALTRGDDGSLTWSVPGALQDGTAPTWT